MMSFKTDSWFWSFLKAIRVGPAILLLLLLTGTAWPLPQTEHLSIRGHQQMLHLYGTRGDPPVIVSSGDGGWVHLGPDVAEFLSRKGFFVVGFDTKEYLESFTSGKGGLRVEDEPGDYRVLADYAARGSSQKPVLIGVSEGAGLSVLAGTDPETKRAIAGVIGLGLPDMNELAWHWKDAVIYVTHTAPKEPLFSTASVVGKISPVPLAVIHSTHDEFVSLDELNTIFSAAKQPKKLWIVKASNHRFSDNLEEFDKRLLEAIDWLAQNQP
jgi:alpha-beta hydrolase superfamily lysophospholipase